MSIIQTKKPPKFFSKDNTKIDIFSLLSKIKQNLYLKYSKGEYNFSFNLTNNLVFNEKCSIVSRFKDFLILDDDTEFFKKVYVQNELKSRFSEILTFYTTYSKIFPNYMILPENTYLYKNIRRKQKMIDAFNQIKKEEEENRKQLQLGKKKNSKQPLSNIFFKEHIKNSINKYKFDQTNENDIDTSLNSISISLFSKKPIFINNTINNDKYKTPSSSYIFEDSLSSIALIVQNFNNSNEKENNTVIETPKRIRTPEKRNKDINTNIINQKETLDLNNDDSNLHIQSALNNNKKFISHKSTISFPEANSSIKIINNYHNIIIPQGTNAVININTNYYQCDKDEGTNEKEVGEDNKIKESSNNNSNLSPKFTNSTKKCNSLKKDQNSISKPKGLSSSKKRTEYSSSNTKYKSPEKLNKMGIFFNKKKEVPTTIVKTSHVMPIYKNKRIYTLKVMTAIQNKVNPFKKKIDKKQPQSKKSKKDFASSFTSKDTNSSTNKKENKVICMTEENDKEENKDKDKEKEKDVNESKQIKNINSKEMKIKYKNYLEKNKKESLEKRKSIDNQQKKNLQIVKGNSTSITKTKHSEDNVINSQRKEGNLKTPLFKKLFLSPNNINFNNNFDSKNSLTAKIKLKDKNILNKDNLIQLNKNPRNLISSINFRTTDSNTKKMIFIKK